MVSWTKRIHAGVMINAGVTKSLIKTTRKGKLWGISTRGGLENVAFCGENIRP